MFSFMTMVTTILVLTHCYIFWRLRAAFGGGVWQILVLLVFVAMIGVVMASRPPIRAAVPGPLVKMGYFWLGLVMVSTLCFACVDAARILLWLAAKLSGGGPFLTARNAGILAVALSCCVSAYAYWRAMTPAPVFLEVASEKIPAGSAPLRIVAVSDIHLGPFIGHARLERVTRAIAEQKPDLLVLLGDVVDTDMNGRVRDEELLQDVAIPEKSFAVLGNHEAYRGVAQAQDFLRRSGYTVLRNRSADAGGIIVAGVDDPALGSSVAKERELLASLDQSRFILFLRHRPAPGPELAGLYDLQLSGHTHGGQIWPGRILVERIHNVSQGLSRIPGNGKESLLYVLNGAGFWGPPMRLGATPEVLVIDIIPSQN